jgi:hypothetical protein
VASFLLYAYGALALHQDLRPGWALEAAGPLPAAVSHLVYRTPLGALDHNVWEKFVYRRGTVQEVLAQAANRAIPPGAVDKVTGDGIGAGSDVFTTFALEVFGINLSSLVKFYLVVVGLSVLAFVLRFHDKRLLVVPIYCLAVTAMLLTPICTAPEAVDQAPIGGQRYFVLAAILPALHIFFEILDSHAVAGPWRRHGERVILFVQACLLFGALLVRSSTGYLVGPLLIVLLWKLYRNWRQPNELRDLLFKSLSLGNALAIFVAFVLLALSAYVNTGRVFGNVWHRAFVSFSLHPDWPFGNLQSVYDCRKYIPGGLSADNWDQRGHCVWVSSPYFAKNPAAANGTYGAEYEKVLRSAYFYVLFHYPKQVFELYYRIKSARIADMLQTAVRYLFELPRSPVAMTLVAALLAQIFLLAAFAISGSIIDPPLIDVRMSILPVFFLFSLAPQYAALASPSTSIDMICLLYCCLSLGVLTAAQLAVLLYRVMLARRPWSKSAWAVSAGSVKSDQR